MALNNIGVLLQALETIIAKKGSGCRSAWDILQASKQGQSGIFGHLKNLDDAGYIALQTEIAFIRDGAFWRLQREREALHREHFDFCKTAVAMVVSAGGEDGQGYFAYLREHVPSCAGRLEQAAETAAAAEVLWFPWRRSAARKMAWFWVDTYMRPSQPGGPMQPSFADDFEEDIMAVVVAQNSKDNFAATQQGAISVWCRDFTRQSKEPIFVAPEPTPEPVPETPTSMFEDLFSDYDFTDEEDDDSESGGGQEAEYAGPRM